MNPTPYSFARQFVGVVAAALILVVLVAFFSIPFNLGNFPGEARTTAMPMSMHMT